MRHKNKRLLSMLLTLCMVLSLFGGATITANANGGGQTVPDRQRCTLTA